MKHPASVILFTDGLDRAELEQTALRIESLGYESLWVTEFSGHWQPLERNDLCRLGSMDRRTEALGESAVLGDKVWAVADRFRVVLGPMDLAHYRSLRRIAIRRRTANLLGRTDRIRRPQRRQRPWAMRR